MKIPPGNYTLETFLEYLAENTKELFTQQERKWLKVYLIFVQSDWLKLFEEFKPEKLGDIVHVSMAMGPMSSIDFYVFERAPGLLLFFTSSTEDDYEKSLKRFIDSTRGITEMWISPDRFDEAKSRVISQYKGRVYRFIGRRTAITPIPAKFRPEFRRRISYSGADAEETLKEIEQLYGVLPISIDFAIGDDSVKITNDGLLVLRTINPRTLQVLLDVVDIMLGAQRTLQKVTQNVSAKMETIRIGDKDFKVPEIVAARIHLRSQNLNAVLVEQLFGQREQPFEDETITPQTPSASEFSFIDTTVLEGSLQFSGTVVDEFKGTVFGLSGGESEILLIPKHYTTFESFVRFYRMIVEDVDKEAELSILSEQVA
jgi:hypothetical protein